MTLSMSRPPARARTHSTRGHDRRGERVVEFERNDLEIDRQADGQEHGRPVDSDEVIEDVVEFPKDFDLTPPEPTCGRIADKLSARFFAFSESGIILFDTQPVPARDRVYEQYL